jgi:uncharacterized delta-60 repeat protein
MTSKGLGLSYLVFSVLIFTSSAFSAPGDLDPAFGIQGRRIVTISTNPVQAIHNNTTDIVVQPNGKIIVAGFAYIALSPTSGNDFIIMRFNTDGSLDSSFADGGIFRYDHQGGSDQLYGVALQPDGKIVAAGQVQIDPFNPNPNTAFAVIRLNPNGAFDPSFGTNGLVVTDFMASLDQATEVAIQPDGRIIATGWSTRSNTNTPVYDFALARYNTNGSPDPTFGSGGVVFTDFFGFGDLAQTSVLQPDGKIVVAGHVWINTSSEYDFGLARYNTNGSLDTTFGTGGKVSHPIGVNQNELVRGMALAPDGKLVVVGDFYNPTNGNVQGNTDVVVVRYNANGSFDTSFDGDGKFIYATTQGDRSESAGDVIVQPDGKVLFTGKSFLRTEQVQNGTVSHTELFLIRINQGGSVDSSFGTGGVVFTDFAVASPEPNQVRTGDRGEAITFQPDGKIVVGAEAVHGNGDYRFGVARYLNDIGPITTASTAFDFDGDGRADQAVFRPSDSVWYMLRSTAGFTASQFGISTDLIVPADFDGDRRTDMAVFRNGVWYWLNSFNGSTSIVQFGQAGDIPVPGDYTGDGRSELAVFRQGIWWILDLSNNQGRALPFGVASDKPVPADFDGDSRLDPAVYRDGVWYWLRSSDNGFRSLPFGLASDDPLIGDFDGDRRADHAVYRSGVWHILGSTQGYFATQFGIASDVPVAADYDGDGKTDVAVFRNGVWYMQRSQLGLATVQFGVANDQPVPAAFAP